jgi:hypothetical protein
VSETTTPTATIPVADANAYPCCDPATCSGCACCADDKGEGTSCC